MPREFTNHRTSIVWLAICTIAVNMVKDVTSSSPSPQAAFMSLPSAEHMCKRCNPDNGRKPSFLSVNNNNDNLEETESGRLTDAAAFVTRSSLTSSLLGVKAIGVDYGLVRTGVAATVGYDPRPLTILSSLNETEAAKAVVQICRDEQAQRVVLGLPLHKNGTEAEQSNLTRAFGSYLSCAVYAEFGPNVPVYLWDERYTSKEAAARVRSRDPKATDLYGELDADAACIILEHYYADGGMRRIGDDKTERLEAEIVPVPEAMKAACEAAWEAKKVELEKAKERIMEERSTMLNAKQAAMERAKALEKQMELNGTLGLGRKKAKKKKKKKKGSGGGGNWVTL